MTSYAAAQERTTCWCGQPRFRRLFMCFEHCCDELSSHNSPRDVCPDRRVAIVAELIAEGLRSL